MGERISVGRLDEMPADRRLSLEYTASGESGESSGRESSIAGIYARVNASWKDGGISLESQVEKCRTLFGG